MLEEAISRTQTLQAGVVKRGTSHAMFTSEGSIAYLAGFWGNLGIEFGCPTILVVPADDQSIIITPLMES